MLNHLSHRLTMSLIALVLTFSALIGALVPAVEAAPAAQTPPVVGNPYGVNLLLDDEVESWKKERTFYLAAQANIQWVKQEFPWNELEFSKGVFFDQKNNKSAWVKYDELVADAEKYGLTMVARLDRTPDWARGPNTTPQTPPTKYSDYADFVAAFLTHYKGRIKYIQIWNEPNLRAEWDTSKDVNASEYVQMLKLVYDRVKKVDPSVQVLSAPMAINTIKRGDPDNSALNDLDYWREMYAAGAKGGFDIASANTYGLRDIPTAAPDPSKLNYRRVELLHQIMADNGDGSRPIWFNEYGWNANPGPPTLSKDETIKYGQVSPQLQAQYTVDGINYARKNWPWAGVVFIWYMRQNGLRFQPADSQYYFALVNVDFSLNPVYYRMQQAATAYPGPARNGPLPQPATPPAGVTLPTEAVPTVTVGGGGGVVEPTATLQALAATITPLSLPTVTPNVAATLTTSTTVATATATTGVTTTIVATLTPAPAPTPTGNSGGDNTLLYIIVGVAALLIIGGVVVFLRKPSTAE